VRRILLVLLVALAVVVGAAAIPGAMMVMLLADGAVDAVASVAGSSCEVEATGTTSVSMDRLTEGQMQVAHTVWSVAHQVGVGDRGAIVGIATAMQESTMGANPATKRPNSDVDVGVFQQRALVGWYADGRSVAENVEILNDTSHSARVFFEGHKVTAGAHAAASSPAGPVGYHIPGLKQIKGWEGMEVTRAAQAVQRSAYPTLYAQHEGLARSLVAAFNVEAGGAPAGEVLCDPPGAGDLMDCPATGLAVERGLTPDALRVLRCVTAEYGQMAGGYSGVRPDSMPYHPAGRAVDFMTTPGMCSALGDQIAAFLKANAAQLGVRNVIWCQKIWSVQRDGEGWRAMTDRGSATQNHLDHVHVEVDGNSAGTAQVSSGGWVSPVASGYRLSARFGQPGRAWSSGYHTGLDFASDGGAKVPVLAAADGVVRSAGWGGAYGNLVVVTHADGVETYYAHLDGLRVSPGDRVRAGQQVGPMGDTGNSFGVHLHFEVRRGGSPVDPEGWLSARGVRLAGSRA
jgi:hypothetical protein